MLEIYDKVSLPSIEGSFNKILELISDNLTYMLSWKLSVTTSNATSNNLSDNTTKIELNNSDNSIDNEFDRYDSRPDTRATINRVRDIIYRLPPRMIYVEKRS